MTSGYLSMENTSDKSFKITGISCTSSRAEVHETKVNAAGIMKMEKNIKAGEYLIKKNLSLKKISEEGTGLFVLINHRDAKSYWLNKLEEKQIEPKSNRRVIGVGSQILRALNLKKITVLGTPTKYNAVSGFDIEITGFKNE